MMMMMMWEGRCDVKASESQEHNVTHCHYQWIWLIVLYLKKKEEEQKTKAEMSDPPSFIICDLIYVHCKINFLPITKISVYKSFICSNMQSTLKLTEMLYLFSMVLTQRHIQTHQTFAKKTSWMKNDIFRRHTETGKCIDSINVIWIVLSISFFR